MMSVTGTKKMMVENARGNEEVCDAHEALEKIDPFTKERSSTELRFASFRAR